MTLLRSARSILLCAATLVRAFAEDGAIPAAPSASPSPTVSQRYNYYLHRTYSWQRLSWLAVDTVIDHAIGDPEWGRGAGGFGCGYASSFGRRLISNSVEFGAGLALGEDIGFHASGRTGLFARTRYAFERAFVISTSRGTIEPAYARYAGIASGAMIAPAWHRRTLSASGFFEDVGFSGLDQIQNSLLTEFSPDLEKLGRQVRKKVFGK